MIKLTYKANFEHATKIVRIDRAGIANSQMGHDWTADEKQLKFV